MGRELAMRSEEIIPIWLVGDDEAQGWGLGGYSIKLLVENGRIHHIDKD